MVLCHIGTTQAASCSGQFVWLSAYRQQEESSSMNKLINGGNTSLLEKKQRFSSSLDIVSLLHDLWWRGHGFVIRRSIVFELQTSHKCFIPRVLLISFISATATHPGWSFMEQIMTIFKVYSCQLHVHLCYSEERFGLGCFSLIKAKGVTFKRVLTLTPEIFLQDNKYRNRKVTLRKVGQK